MADLLGEAMLLLLHGNAYRKRYLAHIENYAVAAPGLHAVCRSACQRRGWLRARRVWQTLLDGAGETRHGGTAARHVLLSAAATKWSRSLRAGRPAPDRLQVVPINTNQRSPLHRRLQRLHLPGLGAGARRHRAGNR